jgi:hypothetical protein
MPWMVAAPGDRSFASKSFMLSRFKPGNICASMRIAVSYSRTASDWADNGIASALRPFILLAGTVQVLASRSISDQ